MPCGWNNADDNDRVPDVNDTFPFDPTEYLDSDGDGIGDNAEKQAGIDKDTDGDGRDDAGDAFPDDPKEWLDTDGDKIGDNADIDKDNDGWARPNNVPVSVAPALNAIGRCIVTLSRR